MSTAASRLAMSLRQVLEPAEHGPFSVYLDAEDAGSLEQPLAPAAVLVPLIRREPGWQVLLTQRTRHLKHHAGQISFPGGRLEAHDGSRVAAALRETYEEVGIAPGQVTVVGRLDPLPTISGYAVTPIVGIVKADYRLQLDRQEVESAFEVPLDFLMNKGNWQRQSGRFQGRRRRYYLIEHGDHRIWGATAAILANLVKRLDGWGRT